MSMRRFRLVRHEDVSGVSGTGVVAEGVQFSSGRSILSWCSDYGTLAVYDSIDHVEVIHGHEGRTELEWLDPAEPDTALAGSGAAREDLADPAERYGVPGWVVDDLKARRRAGAGDVELLKLLAEPARGGISGDAARALLTEIDA